MASKKSKQEEALKFLDDLDSFAPPPDNSTGNDTQSGPSVTGSGNEGEAAEVLAFLDEITQKSTEPIRTASTHISRSGTPTLRKSTERVRLGGGSSLGPSSSSPSLIRTSSSDSQRSRERSEPTASTTATAAASTQNQSQGGSSGGWGWGSVWSSASAAIQQAKTVVDEQVKHLPKNEQARKWGEGVMEYAKSAQLDKLSTRYPIPFPEIYWTNCEVY